MAKPIKISIDGRKAYSYKPGLAEFSKELDILEEIFPKITMAGLRAATEFLIKDMMPKTPMKTGDLRKSIFYVTSMGSVYNKNPIFVNPEDMDKKKAEHTLAISKAMPKQKRTKQRSSITLGYSAYYAWRIHNLADAKMTTPGTETFWFENAVKRNKEEMKKIIKNYTAEQIKKAREKRTKEIMNRPMVHYKESYNKNRFLGKLRNDMFGFND